MHTDGLEDAWNNKKMLFNMNQVETIIKNDSVASPDVIIDKITGLRAGFKHSKYLEDDITLLLLKIL